MEIKMIQSLPGNVRNPEDGLIVQHPFWGVADGASEVYYPGKPQMNFSSSHLPTITGGQMAVNCLKNVFADNPTEKLGNLISFANLRIRGRCRKYGLNVEDAGSLPGASFIIARIPYKAGGIKLIQSGDSLAVWRCRDGSIGFTDNLVYDCEMERLAMIDQLSAKHQGNQGEMWKEFGPWLEKNRRRVVNKRYPILNGMKIALKLLTEYNIENPQFLIIFTDGVVNYSITNKMNLVAEHILGLYSQGGLDAVFKEAKEIEQNDKPKHILGDEAEKTAIAIEF